ncbi:L-tyrosine decarboxylase [Fusarium agapanthi]|uniref:L-tyrosine decarboxylase n=1 Tax=Fusarium agapanthi TaxID=1803897 RepID=A0A9P5BF78_9HYPO|nr:L-tyrosine decarboxylase [Fusarium agapanthi]
MVSDEKIERERRQHYHRMRDADTAAMMYNPNNVATEASPYTTSVERDVGVDLCRMLGYGYGVGGEDSDVVPWGHITCDGSVANLEAIWAIRTLKFYPLSLKLAMVEGAPLNFLTRIEPPFKVTHYLQSGVVIIGSTEHGACDPLRQVVELREGFQTRGLSFAIHADAAWGGYFSSMIERRMFAPVPGGDLPFVPKLAIQPYTREQLECLPFADSITIDPHKLLGEAIFTCTKLYCHWAILTKPEDDLIVVPLIRLPIERNGGSAEDVAKEKERIRKKILGVNNEDLFKDEEAWELLETLSGDIMINAFACNFRINGKPNTNIVEANYLSERIFQRLSYTIEDDETPISDRPLFLTSSSFGEKAYGKCMTNFKRCLELSNKEYPAHGDLKFLVNVTMRPWPTDSPFLESLVTSFRKIAEEEVHHVLTRNVETPDFHGFVVQGHDKIYLVHIPMFNVAAHRWQVITTAELPSEFKELYQKLRKENPGKFYTIANVEPEKLGNLLESTGDVEFRMDDGLPDDGAEPLAKFKLSNIDVVLSGDHVKLNLNPALSDEQLGKGVVAVPEHVYENSIQPLPQEKNEEGKLVVKTDAPGLSLVADHKHRVSVYNNYDEILGGSKPIASGDLSLTSKIFADWRLVNMD